MLNPALVSLRLDFCGHLDCESFNIMSNALPHLKRIELLGPFLVRPVAWVKFFETHPHLEGFLVTQCPRFDVDCVKSLIKECRSLNDLRLKEMKVDETWLQVIGESNSLKSLDLSSPHTSCSDDALVQMLSTIGPGLSALNLSSHESITDGFLEDGLGKWTGSLERLSLAVCPELTDRALSRLFDTWAGGDAEAGGTDSQQAALTPEQVDGPVRLRNRRRPPPRQKKAGTVVRQADAPLRPNVPLVAIEMGRNHLLGPRSLLSIMRHSGSRLESLVLNGWKDVTTESLEAIGNYGHELKKLDVGWCRNVDDFVLAGWVGFRIPVEGSERTTDGRCLKLNDIRVWGCNRVTGRFPTRVSLKHHRYEEVLIFLSARCRHTGNRITDYVNSHGLYSTSRHVARWTCSYVQVCIC